LSGEIVMRAELARARAFVESVAGLPYAEGANGPRAYDCWGIARRCERELFGRELPVGSRDPAELAQVFAKIVRRDSSVDWIEVKRPQHGDVVTLRHTDHPRHIGVWLALNRGAVLHAVENAGVQLELRAPMEMQGWTGFRFFRPQAGAAA
jgi:cell wall-associated NlpC family hydrolase